MTHKKVSLASTPLEPIEIFHLHIVLKGRILLFQRACGIWNFLSGEIESGESSITAGCREAMEETGLIIRPDKIEITKFSFSGLSPNGKPIKGRALFSNIPDFCPSDLDLDTFEIKDWSLFSVESAFKILERGFPEARQGLAFLIERGIVPYSV